ncbi:MAG: signal peptidase I [bacterium]|nr:signal peptidase I [bacterium]
MDETELETDGAREPTRSSRLLRDLMTAAAFALLVLAARSSLADHYVIPSGSMEHTLVPGDRVFVDKRAYGLRIPFTWIELIKGEEPKLGDVVIFDSPEDGTRLIKRIVGVGGSTVELKNGHLSINGKAMRIDRGEKSVEHLGEHLAQINLAYGGGPNIEKTMIPAGKILVVGDARGNSRDGRFFGLIEEQDIYGLAIARYWRTGTGLGWEPM